MPLGFDGDCMLICAPIQGLSHAVLGANVSFALIMGIYYKVEV